MTANELHVPVSDAKARPTFLKLESADVVHSFWVPQLAGKTDVIPNRDNQMWIEPTEPGIYVGNCAEHCGMQHAHMLLRLSCIRRTTSKPGGGGADCFRCMTRLCKLAAMFPRRLPV